MQARIPFPALRRAGPGVGDTGAASSGIRQFLKLPKAWLQIAGVAVLLAPLVRGKRWGDFDWRLAYLSSVLMWVVVFNHKTESPTFVIAMFGVALSTVVEPPSPAQSIALALAFVLTSLSSTDLVPRYLRREIVRPLAIKAVPIFVLWGLSVWRLLAGSRIGRTEPLPRQSEQSPSCQTPAAWPHEPASPVQSPAATSD